MPELPEVETIKQGLGPYIINTKIKDIVIRQPSLRWPVPNNLDRLLKNRTIIDIQRRAKYLLIYISHNIKKLDITGILIIHLGMSGKLQIVDKNTPVQKHDHVDFVLDNKKILRFNDPRRFGAILWISIDSNHSNQENVNIDNVIKTHERFVHLGPEPLTNKFNLRHIKQKIKNRKTPVKNFIMDNNIVVGVGNIYATEALFYSRISPTRPVNTITDTEWELLISKIKKVLKKAIQSGGTTLKDFANSDGKPGYFQQQLSVYGRCGERCVDCNSVLQSIKQQGRTTVFCPKCQN